MLNLYMSFMLANTSYIPDTCIWLMLILWTCRNCPVWFWWKKSYKCHVGQRRRHQPLSQVDTCIYWIFFMKNSKGIAIIIFFLYLNGIWKLYGSSLFYFYFLFVFLLLLNFQIMQVNKISYHITFELHLRLLILPFSLKF